MELQRSYQRCHLIGEGEVKTPDEKARFHIVDISASGAAISLPEELTEGETYDLSIRFHGSFIDFNIHTKGKVIRWEKRDNHNIYGIRFTGISDKDRVEIDEIVKYSCPIGEKKAFNQCEAGNCTVNNSRKPNRITAGRH